MRYFLLYLFFGAFSTSYSQILDPYTDWFGLQEFFVESEVKASKIKSIHFAISTKKDNQIFKEEGELLQFEFDSKGKVIKSLKRIPLRSGFDTSYFHYEYDSNQRILKQLEHQGPFDFEYHYQYLDENLFTSLKIRPDKSKSDTLYERNHEILKSQGECVELIKNRQGKAFMKCIQSYDAKGALQEESTVYLFNKNEVKCHYFTENNLLVGKHYQKEFGLKNDQMWKYNYTGNQLESVERLKRGTLIEKIGFIYQEQLPTAIIVRNIQDQYIQIYRITYEYF